jgi:hypothetical protein
MATSPSIENLSVLTGVLKWKESGSGSYRDLGEATSLTTTMDFTTLPYMSRRLGSLTQVKEITTGKTMTVSVTLNEPSDLNLEMLFSGVMTGSPAVIEIGTAEVRGALRYIGKNDVGVKVQIDLFDVIFVPSGDTNWLQGDDWAGFTLTGRALADAVTGSFGQIRPDTTGTEVAAGSPAV